MRTCTDNFDDFHGVGIVNCKLLKNGNLMFGEYETELTKKQALEFAKQIIELCEEK